MEQDKTNELYELIDNIPVTPDNSQIIEEIKLDLENKDYMSALDKIEQLGKKKKNKKVSKKEKNNENDIEKSDEEDEDADISGMFPKKLSNKNLERKYIGLLLTDPRYIVKYFYVFNECYFEDPEMLNIYKSVLFTEGRSICFRTC